MFGTRAASHSLIRPEHLVPHWRWDRAIPSRAICRSISNAGSISIACAITSWRAPTPREQPCGALLLLKTSKTTSATSPAPRSGNGSATSYCGRFRAIGRRRRADRVGFRLGRGASSHQLRLACAGQLPRRYARHAPYAVPPSVGLMKAHAEEVMTLLRAAGVADMPVSIDIARPRCSSNYRRRA